MSNVGFVATGRRQYSQPPIQEVLIQVSLPPGSLENAALPGQLYERLRDAYPADVQTEIQVQVPVGLGDPASAGPPILRQASRYIFASEEGEKKLILGNNHLSANALPPYEGWEDLSNRFTLAASALFDVRPELAADTLSVRYINRVVIPEKSINTDDYFTIPVRTAEEGTAPFTAFSITVQSVLGDDQSPVICKTAFSSGEVTEAGLTYFIDIELSHKVNEVDSKQPGQWRLILEDLHSRENSEFESIITDQLRRLFNA